MTSTRIYRVFDADEKEADRLVEAVSQAAAIRFVASRYNAEAANAKDVADLMSKGTKIEHVETQS